MIAALKSMKSGRAPAGSGVSCEMLKASGEIGVSVLEQLANMIVADGSAMPLQWRESVLVPIYKGKGDVMECSAYRGIKLLELGMKVVERVLEMRLRKSVEISRCQCGFMPGRGTMDAVFTVRRVMENIGTSTGSCICVLWIWRKCLIVCRGE